MALSARIIPGNEKGIYRMINHFAKRGADVIYGTMNPPVHVSGHGSAEELRLVLNLVRPRYFRADPRRIPADGQARRAGAASAPRGPGRDVRAGIRRDAGDRSSRARAEARRCRWAACASIPARIDEVVEDIVIRDRRHLSEDGFVLPIIAINKHSGKSEGLPEIVSRGFMSIEDGSELLQEARQVVVRTLESSSEEERADWGVMQEKIRADLKRFLNKADLAAAADHAGDSGSVNAASTQACQ